jgi:hypothetical protein
MLEHVRLVRKVNDALRNRRPIYQVTEPLLRLHYLVIRPYEARLAGRARERVWAEVADSVAAQIQGPHLEELARSWCMDFASSRTLGGLPSRCEPALLACHEHKTTHELDVVVSEDAVFAGNRVLAIGEVKATRQAIGLNQLRRLEHLTTLLPAAATPEPPRLLLFSRHGFTPDLASEITRRSDVELIDLNRLYRGD